jgi:very-short-patch-repair endonuclease
LVRRRDLFPDQTDHPRAEEAYYKIELGPLIELKRPITSRSGRRILFIWTTGDKFSRAVEINDLLGKSDEDDALWDALKASKICAERQIVVRDKRARYRVDFWIQCARGNLAVVLGDAARKLPKGKAWRSLKFSTRELEQNLTDCTHQVSKMIKELGGIKYNAEKIS